MSRYNSINTDTNTNFNDKFDAQDPYQHRRRSPSNFRGSGGGGGHRPFDSPPRQHHNSAGGGGGFRPIGGGGGGGGFWPMAGGFEGNYPNPSPHHLQPAHTGQKRPFPFSGRGGVSPNRDRFGGAGGGGNFAKLFVGSVPRTAREEDIRHLFEEHGDVIEVALIKDKKTGQPQGMYECCFILGYLLLYLSYFRCAERLIGANLSSSSSQFVFDTSSALVGFGCYHLFLCHSCQTRREM